MNRNSRLKILLIELSVLPSIFIAMFLCIGLLHLFVLQPLGLPAPPEARAHSIKFFLEMIFGIPVILVIGWMGIFSGVLLWSIFVNLFSLRHKVEQAIQHGSTINVHYRSLLLWGLHKITFGRLEGQ